LGRGDGSWRLFGPYDLQLCKAIVKEKD
jgi:hypothetical protein